MEKYLCASTIDNKLGFELDYFIVCSILGMEDGISIVTYGIEIQKLSISTKRCVDSNAVHDICLEEHMVIKFAKLLCENSVMPCNLCEIVFDKMEEGYFEANISGSILTA